MWWIWKGTQKEQRFERSQECWPPQLCEQWGSYTKKTNLEVHTLNHHTRYDPVEVYLQSVWEMFQDPIKHEKTCGSTSWRSKKAEMAVRCRNCGKQSCKEMNRKVTWKVPHKIHKWWMWCMWKGTQKEEIFERSQECWPPQLCSVEATPRIQI